MSKTDMPDRIWANEHKVWSTSEKYLNNKGAPRPASHSRAKRFEYIRADLVGIKCFYEDDLPSKFIAIYSDGSGCDIYYEDGEGSEFYIGCGRGVNGVQKDWFFDTGYLWFVPLPDDFEVWEVREDGQ